MAGTAPKRRRLAEYAARPKPATRPTSSCSLVGEHRDSIPEGAGPAGQPSHIFHRRCACPAPPLQWDGGDGGNMAKDETKRSAEARAYAALKELESKLSNAFEEAKADPTNAMRDFCVVALPAVANFLEKSDVKNEIVR